tara:strand:+ start:1032 stop:1196 length:165 start_codon:yes stop_codon:yes gene_type:complete
MKDWQEKILEREGFNKMMGYPLDAVEELAKQAKKINRIVKLNERDLQQNGIENN